MGPIRWGRCIGSAAGRHAGRQLIRAIHLRCKLMLVIVDAECLTSRINQPSSGLIVIRLEILSVAQTQHQAVVVAVADMRTSTKANEGSLIWNVVDQAKTASHIRKLWYIYFCIEIWVHSNHSSHTQHQNCHWLCCDGVGVLQITMTPIDSILPKLDFAYLESCDPICWPCQLC